MAMNRLGMDFIRTVPITFPDDWRLGGFSPPNVENILTITVAVFFRRSK